MPIYYDGKTSQRLYNQYRTFVNGVNEQIDGTRYSHKLILATRALQTVSRQYEAIARLLYHTFAPIDDRVSRLIQSFQPYLASDRVVQLLWAHIQSLDVERFKPKISAWFPETYLLVSYLSRADWLAIKPTIPLPPNLSNIQLYHKDLWYHFYQWSNLSSDLLHRGYLCLEVEEWIAVYKTHTTHRSLRRLSIML